MVTCQKYVRASINNFPFAKSGTIQVLNNDSNGSFKNIEIGESILLWINKLINVKKMY